MLPPSLPSSFEGGIGYVRYLVKGTIDRPWRFDDDTVRPFTVLSALDLNQQPMAGVREFYWSTSFAMLQNRFLHKYTLQFLINICKSNIVFYRMEPRQQIQRICVACVVNLVQLRVQ